MEAACARLRPHGVSVRRRRLASICWATLVLLMASSSAVAAENSTATSTSTASSSAATSDFVALFYRLYNETNSSTNTTLLPVALESTDVPTEIRTRLQTYALAFDDLPPLAQRALLWDSGYSISDNTSSLAQIYTLCGSTMSSIGLSKSEFSETGCPEQSCGSTASTPSYSFSLQCRADKLVAAAKCSSTAVTSESTLPLWTEPTTIQVPTTEPVGTPPELRMRRHRWVDTTLNQPVHVFAVQSEAPTSTASSSTSGYCSSTSPRVLAIPCVPFQPADTRWCRPQASQLMDQWLDSLSTQLLTEKRIQIDAANAEQLAQRKTSASAMKDDDGVVMNPDFRFDGTSSDLAQQFYRRFKAGDSAAAMEIESPLPQEIRQRLRDVSLEFEELPPLLQRALVWDSGYGYGDGKALATIYVPCGSSMAEIALSRRALNLAGCEEHNCTDPTSGNSFSRMKTCTGDQIAAASLCATTDVTSPVHVSVWADGGSEDLVPDVNVQRHTWEVLNRSYLIYGIHVVRDEVAQGNCPARGAMVIPCLPYQAVVAASPGRWCRPKPSALVTSWMRLTAKNKQFNLLLLFPILLSVALAVTGLTCIIRRKTWKRLDAKLAQQHSLDHEFSQTAITTSVSQEHGDEDYSPHETYAFVRSDSSASSVASDAILSASSNGSRSSIESFAATSANWVLHTLVNNPLLASRRVDYTDLRFDRVVAKGGNGEVWRCRLRNQQIVAVKRLLRTKKHHYSDLEAFTQEIALTASMDHVNIVRFLGVAWTTLPNLCMVSEFMANGDLQQYLRRDDVSLEWTTEKLHIAGGIANALHYIHSREPKTIHRDLKSKNVMLSATMEAKLIDFGVSRSQLSDVMTKGVGTPYWTAPEILEGQAYSEKADMFSFGIVLCELDTALSPYEDRKTSEGTPEFTPLQILQHVVSGELRPTISESCPQAVATLARACLHRNANARPTADEAMAILQRCDPASIIVASVEVPTRFHSPQLEPRRSSQAFHL